MKGDKMKKLLLGCLLVLGLIGCTNSQTAALVEQQNAEVLALQQMRRQILLRPTRNAQELAYKKAELKMIDDEIRATQYAQYNAQQIQSQKTNNAVKGVITGVGAVLGTAATIHHITR